MSHLPPSPSLLAAHFNPASSAFMKIRRQFLHTTQLIPNSCTPCKSN
jgi:hypothetical protein